MGSIGVIAAGFGFVDAIRKLGIERRVHTAGESKSVLDPFQPEKSEDVERLKSLQRDVHEDFKRLVRSRRDGKLRGEDSELFSGAFWSGRQALALGLIDGIGHMRDILRARFGDRTEFKLIARPQGWGLRRLGFGPLRFVSGSGETPRFLQKVLMDEGCRALDLEQRRSTGPHDSRPRQIK